MEFDLLDAETQAAILRRREAEATSERNRNERKFHFTRARFHQYQEGPISAWVRDSIYQGLVKNYKLKKSGVKMTLDQKHLYDRVVTPVELALKRILRQAPMVIVSEVSEKKALLAATKAAAASVARGGKQRALEEKKRLAEEEAKKKAEEENDKLNTKKKKKKSKKEREQEEEEASIATGGATKLADMTPLELDQTFMHAFNVFADRMATTYCRLLTMKGDLKVPKATRIAHFTSYHIRAALRDAEEKLQNSPITALLPLVQFNEKVLVTAAKLLHNWDIMEEVGAKLCSSWKMKDKTWAQKAIACLSSCFILKYSADEKNRLRGENIAACILQAGMKGFIVRQKMRRIWEIANKKYAKEYEEYLEQQRLQKFLQEEEALKALDIKNEQDSYQRKLLLQKIGVEWAEAYVHKVTMDSVVIQVNMRIGGKLPTKDYFRTKNVNCTVRMYEPAEHVRDVNCTAYMQQLSSSASMMSDMTQARIGQLEVLIDDIKKTEAQTVEWNKYGDNVILPSTILWDSATKLKKSKLINVYDLHDDGRDLDIATCFITVSGMEYNSCYNAKLLINPQYNPEADYSTKEPPPTVTVAVLEYITSPIPPRPPHINKPDLIHFDHAIVVTKEHKQLDDMPLLGEEESGEDHQHQHLEADSGNDDGLSVVDRLEQFKKLQLERKQLDFNDKQTAKKGMYA